MTDKECEKCHGKGFYEDKASLIKFVCKCQDVKEVQKTIGYEHDDGESW